MASTRKGYIIGVIVTSVLCIVFIILSVSSDYWITSLAQDDLSPADSEVNYGLWTGELQLNNLATPSFNTLYKDRPGLASFDFISTIDIISKKGMAKYVTCIFELNACGVSCKTTEEGRQDEVRVRALAEGRHPNPGCVAVTTIDETVPLTEPRIIHSTFYVVLLVVIFTQMFFGTLATGLAVLNVLRNPTEPILGLPGCLWCNVITATLGSTVLFMFGIYWVTSGLREHLGFSYFTSGLFLPKPSLGYSYWVQLISVTFSVTSVCLIELRRYMLERDPAPPTIKVENYSDGTVFLY